MHLDRGEGPGRDPGCQYQFLDREEAAAGALMLHHGGELALVDRHGEEGQAVGARRSEWEENDELGEEGRFARREFELLLQLAVDCVLGGLAGLDAAAEKAPMVA